MLGVFVETDTDSDHPLFPLHTFILLLCPVIGTRESQIQIETTLGRSPRLPATVSSISNRSLY